MNDEKINRIMASINAPITSKKKKNKKKKNKKKHKEGAEIYTSTSGSDVSSSAEEEQQQQQKETAGGSGAAAVASCISEFSMSSSSNSESEIDDAEKMFYCRFCNRKTKRNPDEEILPQNEVCKSCKLNFPQRMFCKSCKRYYPNGSRFKTEKFRCVSCCTRLEKARLRRKIRKIEDEIGGESNQPEKKKTKKDNEEPGKKVPTKAENYVSIVINGQCVHKHNFII